MKNYILFLLCLNPAFFQNNTEITNKVDSTFNTINVDSLRYNKNLATNFDVISIQKLKPLLSAIIWYESTNGTKNNGDGGLAIGPLQMHKIMVDEVNRIVKTNKYTYEDRNNLTKSIEMFIIYQGYYNPEFDVEKAARIWNGGPQGHTKACTACYWSTIQEYMGNQELLTQSIVNTLPVFNLLDNQLV